MIRLVGLSLFIAFLVITQRAHAASSLLTCEQIGSDAVRKCVLTGEELASPLFDELDQRYLETEFKVPYTFACNPPQGFSIGLQVGSRFDALTPTRSVIQLSGRGSLRVFDPNPAQTKRWHFRSPGGCSLQIDKAAITTRPTLGEIETWNLAADNQARIINLAIDRYELAKDFAGYRSWTSERLQILLSETSKKVDYFREVCNGGDQAACRSMRHFIVIRNAIETALGHAPEIPAPAPAEISAEINTVLDVYRADLIKDVARGEQMIARFETWEVEAQKALADALALVPNDANGN